nr:polygalacturonase-like [Ipomoea batatas]GMC86097.1 polygalacturonase-like [Ipomoea batatas]GMC88680.1 polygalacturonase-like [Ipomoea batatas]
MPRNISPFVLLIIVTVVLTLAPSCLEALHHQQHYSHHNNVAHNYLNHLDEESGYYSRAYPSYNLEGMRSTRFLASVTTVNVDDYGAKGDGTHDDTVAFQKAWKVACSSIATTAVYFQVSKKNYLLRPISFSGPCKSAIAVQIYGSIEASDDRSDYKDDRSHWLKFSSVQNLMVEGDGTINGNGKIWWQNSCKVDTSRALTFHMCNYLIVKNLRIQNAQRMHISFDQCTNVRASNLVVTAPGNSPNTDGIHVTKTKNIQISDCTIGTGDDCISIVSGSQNIEVTGITCGPGHGISIGSLGSGNSKAYVSNIVVNGAKLSGTANGVRIKTWQSSAVQVKNVVYENIAGTSATEIAVKFDCSKNHPCKGIVMKNVELVGEGDEIAKAECNNVRFSNLGTVSPKCPPA